MDWLFGLGGRLLIVVTAVSLLYPPFSNGYPDAAWRGTGPAPTLDDPFSLASSYDGGRCGSGPASRSNSSAPACGDPSGLTAKPGLYGVPGREGWCPCPLDEPRVKGSTALATLCSSSSAAARLKKDLSWLRRMQ